MRNPLSGSHCANQVSTHTMFGSGLPIYIAMATRETEIVEHGTHRIICHDHH